LYKRRKGAIRIRRKKKAKQNYCSDQGSKTMRGTWWAVDLWLKKLAEPKQNLVSLPWFSTFNKYITGGKLITSTKPLDGQVFELCFYSFFNPRLL